MHIVFATCKSKPDISVSDRFLAAGLERLGATVAGAAWNREAAPFLQADGVVIRTTWDYFDYYPEFCAWLEMLERHEVRVLNPLPILRWNIHKRYLFELNSAGLPTLPLEAVPPDVDAIREVALNNGWERAVLKCLISGTARGLSLFAAADESAIKQAINVAAPWSEYGLVVQPFMDEITRTGELSMVFVDGRFTHAVRKTPKPDEFRIQSEFGGQYARVDPPGESLEAARRCLQFVEQQMGDMPLYARVDGLIIDGAFKLMELELAEPELMFPLAPESAATMAAAILQRWK